MQPLVELIPQVTETRAFRVLKEVAESLNRASTEQEAADIATSILEGFPLDRYPHIAEMVAGITHDEDTTLGWCDDQAEFEFSLDLLLDGLDRLRHAV